MKTDITKTLTTILSRLNVLTGSIKGLKPKRKRYPWTTTPVGGSFLIKHTFGKNTQNLLKSNGIKYSQNKTKKGLRATRIA